MIKYDAGYEALIKALSGFISTVDDDKIFPLARLVLPSTIFEQIKKNYDLVTFSSLGKKSCSFSLEDEQQASSLKYDIDLYVPDVHSDRKTIRIVVSDINNPDTSFVYKANDENNHEYEYGFVKKNKNGILLLNAIIETNAVSSNENTGTCLTSICIKAFDKETTDFIGTGYLVPGLLLNSHKYGVEPDFSENYKNNNFYLKDVINLFHQKADEILSDSANLNKKKF